MEYSSVGVLREGRIAPRVRGVGDAERAADVGVAVTFALISDSILCSTTSDISKIRSPFQGEAFGWKLPRAEALGYVV